jgi:hypothetical protein
MSPEVKEQSGTEQKTPYSECQSISQGWGSIVTLQPPINYL